MSFMAIVVLSSCTRSFDKIAYSSALDSLLKNIETEITIMKDIVLIPLNAKQDSVESKITRIQSAYTGTMDAKTAALVSNYKYIVKSLPNAEEKALDELRNLLLSKQQIQHLKQAVESNATHDALGNKITDTYLKAALDQEKTGAEIALQSAQQLREKYVSMNASFDQLNPSIDSLLLTIQASK